MRVQVHNITNYHYNDPASFSVHVVRLFPRQDHALRVDAFELATNEAAVVQHRRDLFDNTIASCFFPESSHKLTFDLTLRLDVQERNPFHFLLEPHALKFPFTYTPRERRHLEPFLSPPVVPLTIPGWKGPDASHPTDTVPAMVTLNRFLHETIAYERREEGPPFPPEDTLVRRKGACRDISLLLAAVLRQHGIAARLASGFLCEWDTKPDERRATGALHAWVEAYIPGAGWLGMDPTNGVLCDHLYIATAVGVDPEDVAPVSGSYFSDRPLECHMSSSVNVEKLS